MHQAHRLWTMQVLILRHWLLQLCLVQPPQHSLLQALPLPERLVQKRARQTLLLHLGALLNCRCHQLQALVQWHPGLRLGLWSVSLEQHQEAVMLRQLLCWTCEESWPQQMSQMHTQEHQRKPGVLHRTQPLQAKQRLQQKTVLLLQLGQKGCLGRKELQEQLEVLHWRQAKALRKQRERSRLVSWCLDVARLLRGTEAEQRKLQLGVLLPLYWEKAW
jgi:hypothetical protein